MNQQTSRRNVVKGAAWGVPTIAVAAAAPAVAASPAVPTCTTKLISAPWYDTYYSVANVGHTNTYIAYVMYPTSDTSGSAIYDTSTPRSEYASPKPGVGAYPSDYCDCTTTNNIQGATVTIVVEDIAGDTQYSPTPKTYNDVSGNDPSGNAWPYLITQQPDRGTNYQVTTYGAFQPQPGSLDNQYNGVMSTNADGRPQWTWVVTMIAPSCSSSDGAGAIEYQLFFPPHYAPAGKICDPQFRITTTTPWGTNVFTTAP